MAAVWTHDSVAALAPDAASVRSGEGLSKPGQWVLLGCSDRAAWGEIKGSGSKPYQVRVDLEPFGYKCSCPSRKLPCKHALGLLFILGDQPNALNQSHPPDWVTEWIDARADRAEKKQAKAQTTAQQVGEKTVSDPAARRAAKRAAAVQAGVEELSAWLGDLLRQGLASARGQPSSYWDAVAARMVDAQAPGLAYAVQTIAQVALGGDNWQERTLRHVASLHLLLEAFQRGEQLPPDLQESVRALIGWTVSRECLKELPVVRDQWLVTGQRTVARDRLREQRTWLWGPQTNQAAVVLQYAAAGQPFETVWVPGAQSDSEMVYYPGAWSMRAALVQSFGAARPAATAPPGECIEAALSRFGQALAHHLWLRPWPMLLAGVTPAVQIDAGGVEHWQLVDAHGCVLDCPPNVPCGWDLLAVSGGEPITVFGEWDSHEFVPMGAWYGQGTSFVALTGEVATLAEAPA